MRKLSWNALSMMDGCTVIIHDEEYDAYDQEGMVIIKKRTIKSPVNKKKNIEIVDEMIFENEEFSFVYTPKEGCVNGKFSVYSK